MERVSIAGLMGAVVFCGLGFAAIRDPNDYWSGTILLLTLGILGYAMLASFYRRGTTRAGWVGFNVFGTGYFLLTTASGFSEDVRAHLPTTQLIRYCDRLTHSRPPKAEVAALQERRRRAWHDYEAAQAAAEKARGPLDLFPTYSPGRGAVDRIDRALDELRSTYGRKNQAISAERQLVGHNLFALLSGLVGALLARRLERGRAPASPS